VGVIAHVVRCFDDGDIIHVNNKVDPASDIEVINTELALADLDTLAKRKEKAEKTFRVQNADEKKNAGIVLDAISKIEPVLENGKPVRSVISELTDDQRTAIYDCHFITAKNILYVCNTDEAGIKAGNKYIETVKAIADSENAQSVCICGKFEAELAGITEASEKLAFLEDIGLTEPSLSPLIRAAYKSLGLRTFFTAGADECRAWTIHSGDTAPKAAGVIHTDFEKGFIKAEVYKYDDIVQYGTEAKIKEAGKYRQEGRDYIVEDGDVMFFKFNN
jgi:GTP-binding protein YchF